MADCSTRKQILDGYLRFEGSTLIKMTARNARGRAHAPYSGFRVGAAILARTPVKDSSGHPVLHVFGGCNVENAAFDSSECAETGALMAARAAGAGNNDIIACYVSGTSRPCAGCLQKLAEFSFVDDPIMVHCSDGNDGGEWLPLPVLLPNQFPDPGSAAAIARTPITVPPGRKSWPGERSRAEIIANLVHQYEHRQPREVEVPALATLFDDARHASECAYNPYSKFAVGAAVLVMYANGGHRVFHGCNIENAVHGSTMCAERVALGSALADGALLGKIVACAIIGPTEQPIAMCGECRQFFSEFSPPEDPIMIFCGNKDGEGKWVPFTKILPRQFP